MMAVRFTVDSGEFRPALPQELFAIDPAYRAAMDVLNWTEELKQRLESR